jgi:hypothetical protein
MTTTIFTATCGAELIDASPDLDELLDRIAGIHEDVDDLVVWQASRVVLVLTAGGQTLDLRNRGLGLLGGMTSDTRPA